MATGFGRSFDWQGCSSLRTERVYFATIELGCSANKCLYYVKCECGHTVEVRICFSSSVVHDMGVIYANVKGRLGNHMANVNKLIFVNFLCKSRL